MLDKFCGVKQFHVWHSVGLANVFVLDSSSVWKFCDGSLVRNICFFSSLDPSLLSFGLGSEAV